jgi:hypothetical protein
MSRIGLGFALLLCSGVCLAQAPLPGNPMTAPLSDPGTLGSEARNKHADPAAVEIPLYAGAPVREVLDALNDKGFLIKYDKEQVLPTMRLLERPKATRIDKLLAEILAPWNLRADRNAMDGGWRVRPQKTKKKEVIVEEPTPATSSSQ